MQLTISQKIQLAVANAKAIEKATIEYNAELPDEPGITKDNFLGVPALFNPKVAKDEVKVIHKYG